MQPRLAPRLIQLQNTRIYDSLIQGFCNGRIQGFAAGKTRGHYVISHYVIKDFRFHS